MTFSDEHKYLSTFLSGAKNLLELLCGKLEPIKFTTFDNEFRNSIRPLIEEVESEVGLITSETHSRWQALKSLGLTGSSLTLKVTEFFEWFSKGKLKRLLKSLNSILGSLFKVFGQLEPVKEFKDHLEINLDDMDDGDESITQLGLSLQKQLPKTA